VKCVLLIYADMASVNWSGGRSPQRKFTLDRDQGWKPTQAAMGSLNIVTMSPVLNHGVGFADIEEQLPEYQVRLPAESVCNALLASVFVHHSSSEVAIFRVGRLSGRASWPSALQAAARTA